MSRRPEVPPQIGSFADLYHALPRIKRRAAACGVDLWYEVQAEGSTGPERRKTGFAASLGKLPLALALITEPAVRRGDMVAIRPPDVRKGGGNFDFVAMRQRGITEEIAVSVDDAMVDLLEMSGETSYRVLSRHLADIDHMGSRVGEALNERYRALGFKHSTIIPREAGAEIGNTSPEEAIAQLRAIEDAVVDQGYNTLAGTALLALSMSKPIGDGLRRFELPEGYDLFSKSGEYNGDPTDPHVCRHEVGRLILPNNREIAYCFMTRSRSMNPAYRVINERVLSAATNEIAKYAGLSRARLLGLRTLTA